MNLLANVHLRLIGSGLLVAACVCQTAFAAPAAPNADRPTPAGDSDPFPITVNLAPAIVLAARQGAPMRPGGPGSPGDSVSVSGATLSAGKRAVSVSVTSDGGSTLSTQDVVPDAKGNYRLVLPPPSKAGVYEVTAAAPDGRGKARATFRAVEPGTLGTQAESVVADALKVVDEALAAAQAKIDEQVDSPAKDKARKKLSDAKQASADLRNRSAGVAIKGIIGAVSSDAALLEASRNKLQAVTAAVGDTASEAERVRALAARMSSADIGCHQLAFVTEVFKAVSALLNVKKRVLDTSIGLAKDVVSDATANKAKGAGASPGLAFASSQVVKNLPELESASKLAGNAAGIFADAGAFITDTLFGAYCEQFVGPLSGIMNARFFNAPRKGGDPFALWWTYNYKLTGRVVLYYPKSAKGGSSIRLNGRIEGYAHGFETWEDALNVMFPKLMGGAIQHHFNFPPIEAGGTASAIASQGAAPLSAYVEGSGAGLAVPNSFLISVVGVLEKGSITIALQDTKKDIDATHRVAVLILSPLTGGLGPQITWYPLGFQKVRKFLVNAADGESLKLDLTTRGDVMAAEKVFTGNVDKPTAKAEYTLKVKACNPGC